MINVEHDERSRLLDVPKSEADSASTLLPMLIAGLVLIVVSMTLVLIMA